MTEYDSLIFDKDIANAYREALDEINGLNANKLALGEIEIMMARVLLLLKAINKQAERNRARDRAVDAQAQQTNAGVQQAHTPVNQHQTALNAAVNSINVNRNKKVKRK